jgi:hypothetical protein
MAPRSSPHRPRQTSAHPNQESPDRSGEQSSSRLPGRPADNYDEYDDIGDPLMDWVRQHYPSHHLRRPFRSACDLPRMQQPMWFPALQSYAPVLSPPMQLSNGAPLMCPGYGASPSSAMAYANFQTPPYHYRQPPWAPAPDFSQLMMQPPQRNNTPEPTTTNNNQQLPVHSLQVPPQIPFTSHPGPATLQTGQHLQASSVSHPVPYLNGPPTQQSTSQFPPLNRQPQQEAGPSTHSGQPMVQTLQYAPNQPSAPFNQQPQQEMHPSAQPGQVMAQTPQYVPPNYSMPLPMASYSYPQPNNSYPSAGQSTRPTGRPSGYQGAPGPPRMHWNGRGRGS